MLKCGAERNAQYGAERNALSAAAVGRRSCGALVAEKASFGGIVAQETSASAATTTNEVNDVRRVWNTMLVKA